MVRLTASTIAGAVAVLATTTSAWGIAFYSGYNCNQDENFDAMMYRDKSSTRSDCLVVGEPGLNCKWYKDEGRDVQECTGPLPNILTQSFYFSTGSICGIGLDDHHDCHFNQFDWAPQQCLQIDDLPDSAWHGQSLTFQCRDSGRNDQLRGSVPYIPMGGFNITLE